MIVVDSSALVAILLNEPEKDAFQRAVAGADRCLMSAVNVHETAIVLRVRHGLPAVERLWRLLVDSEIDVIAFDEAQARVAVAAFHAYGKGIHSQARLNLSDCAAYALAKTTAAPLLFKGNDFTHTDLQPCAWASDDTTT